MIPCFPLFGYLSDVGSVLDISDDRCIIFDEEEFRGQKMSKDVEQRVDQFCSWSKVSNFFSFLFVILWNNNSIDTIFIQFFF